jgi:hypothetical protein
MKANEIVKKALSFLGIGALAIMVSCEPGRLGMGERADDGRITEEAQSGTQTAEMLDERIRNFNQEMASVERQVMATESVSEEGFRNDWREIEIKRHELNRNIERYNSAVERGNNLEASELRTEINVLLGELESGLSEFSENYGDGGQDQQMIPETQDDNLFEDDDDVQRDDRDDGIFPN